MFLEMKFHSRELRKDVQVNVLIPNGMAGKSYKTLWLLHGLGDDHTAWMRRSSIERYASELGIAVVMPCADRSWYTNTAGGANYFDLIAKELPTLLRSTFRGMSEKREDNLIAGLSMGGYGALKFALSLPESYGACISLSGALDITRRGRPYDLTEWKSIFGDGLCDALELEGSKHDIFALAEKNKAEGLPFPTIYMWCGTDDSLIEANRAFDKLLSSLDVPHLFDVSEGDHSWKWWDLHIYNALKYLFNK